MRKLAASYWTAGLATLAAVVAHVWWLSWSDHAGEVLSAFGAIVQVIGLLVAARPYIRAGVRGMAEHQVQAPQAPYYDSADLSISRAAQAAYRQKVDATLPDVWAERVVAVAVLGIGTVLNGYGTPIARVFGMRI